MTELANSLKRYLNAVEDLKEAEKACEHDPSYFLSGRHDEVQSAEGNFLDELTARMMERIQNKLK